MSYEPTQWKAGDTVTSAKLNKLEQGVADSNTIIETCEYFEQDSQYYFKSVHTSTEIIGWCKAGKRVVFCFPYHDDYSWYKTEYWPIIGYTDDTISIPQSNNNNMLSNGSNMNSIMSINIDLNTDLLIFQIYVAE